MSKARLIQYALCALALTLPSGAGASVRAQEGARESEASARAQGVLERMTLEEPLTGAPIGVLAVNLRGDTLACLNPHLRLVPASNLKLATCAAALKTLGRDFRFKTTLAYEGSIDEGGILHGNVYIIGGGDPTTGALDSSTPAVEVTFARWKQLLDRGGIKGVDGLVIGDSRSFCPVEAYPDWTVEDAAFYYGAMPQALNFYKNKHDLEAIPGISVGDPVEINQIYPILSWMVFDHLAVTGPAGSGDKLYYAHSAFLPNAAVHGSLGIDKGKRKEQCINRFPAYTCSAQFCSFLHERGLEISRGPADIDPQGYIRDDLGLPLRQIKASPRDSLKVLGSTQSAPLMNIVRECLYQSDNFYAEALLATIGTELTASARRDSCIVAEKQVLKTMGVQTSGIKIYDGSGLSRTNYVNASFFVSLLKAVAGSDINRDFLRALPSPGQGTLYANMSTQTPQLRARIRMKSGSMDGVLCYSGYILPADYDDTPGNAAAEAGASLPEETIVFSILTDNALASSSVVRPVLDRLIILLSQ